MHILLIPIAGAAALLAYAVSHRVIKTLTTVGSPRLIAAIVALLSGISILSLGDGVIALILIPYAALGLSLLFLAPLKWLVRGGAGRGGQRGFRDCSPGRPRRRPGSAGQPGSSQAPSPAHLRETFPTKK